MQVWMNIHYYDVLGLERAINKRIPQQSTDVIFETIFYCRQSMLLHSTAFIHSFHSCTNMEKDIDSYRKNKCAREKITRAMARAKAS